jgi:hypothetical protein
MYYDTYMAVKERVLTFRPDDQIVDGMTTLRERDGMPFSEQIRRALRLFLAQKGVMSDATPRRRPSRRSQS